MKYLCLLSWISAFWLGSAWDQELIGDWGIWTSIGIGSFWLGLVVIAKFWGGEKNESKKYLHRQ